jgi:small basic protein (TIGR04137 family)
MSVHKSLKLRGSLQRSRNVLTRAERISVMRQRGQWEEGRSIYGLPKTRVHFGKKT